MCLYACCGLVRCPPTCTMCSSHTGARTHDRAREQRTSNDERRATNEHQCQCCTYTHMRRIEHMRSSSASPRTQTRNYADVDFSTMRAYMYVAFMCTTNAEMRVCHIRVRPSCNVRISSLRSKLLRSSFAGRGRRSGNVASFRDVCVCVCYVCGWEICGAHQVVFGIGCVGGLQFFANGL